MKELYKSAVLTWGFLWLTTAATGICADVTIARDLLREGQVAEQQGLPILLAFSAIDCSYCDVLEEEFLRPMLISGEYSDRIIIRKLILDNGSQLRDFSGETLEASELALRYKVFVTPTLLFLDRHGRELAARMVGINTIELYGGYLEDCIDTALLGTRDPGRLTPEQPCRLSE